MALRPTRRRFLQGLAAGAASGLVVWPATAEVCGRPQARLVVVLLRGALDGLALLPPVGDPAYEGARAGLALPPPGGEGGALELDGFFALNPAMRSCAELYRAGELLAVQAVATPYRSRSHFDGQDVLENGATGPAARRSGWLNAALDCLAGSNQRPRALALAHAVPLILRGRQPADAWMPAEEASDQPAADTLARLQRLYAEEPLLQAGLERALAARGLMSEGGGDGGTALAEAAAALLLPEEGARVAVLEYGGWDTHAGQGTSAGTLFNRLGRLDASLTALREGLGAAWADTAVLVTTEFGRTVAMNGNRGSDHGTGGAALLLGGAVAGGRVIADWPGLRTADLHEGRDLRPTLDLRSLQAGVVQAHLGLSPRQLSEQVFPDAPPKPLQGLLRTS